MDCTRWARALWGRYPRIKTPILGAALCLVVGCAGGQALHTAAPPEALRQQVAEGGLWVEGRGAHAAKGQLDRQLARQDNELHRFFGSVDAFFIREEVEGFHRRLFNGLLGRLRASPLSQFPWEGHRLVFEVMALDFFEAFNKENRQREIQCVAQVRVELLDGEGRTLSAEDLIVQRFREKPGGRQGLRAVERAVAHRIEEIVRAYAGGGAP